MEYDIPHFFANTQIHITRLHQILNTLDRIHENSSHAWKTSKDSFEIYPRTNELCYNAGATYEADRILKELPETLEVRKSRDCLMMNLEEAQKFFGITFKKSLFPWLSKIFA